MAGNERVFRVWPTAGEGFTVKGATMAISATRVIYISDSSGMVVAAFPCEVVMGVWEESKFNEG